MIKTNLKKTSKTRPGNSSRNARRKNEKPDSPSPAALPSLEEKTLLRERRLFQALEQNGSGFLRKNQLLQALTQAGLMKEDRRLRQSVTRLDSFQHDDPISFEEFCKIVAPNMLLIEKALQGGMIIPDFQNFRSEIERIHLETKKNISGKVADYIPQLGRVNPDQYGVSICTIDGQRHSLGDTQVDFCVQSCCKPINYCLAMEESDERHVHKHVGREPSGRGFNELTLNHEGRPHNPMINAGAIMSAAMIKPNLNIADRFDYVMENWKTLCGNQKPSFSNSVYLSERQTADRNFALGYFMREHGAFPEGTNLIESLEFYFQCCSIELNAEMMATVAATLANGGICPVTGDRVFSPSTVQNCLSLMYTCGMYDFSGEFAFSIGLPAKSGVSGALMIVVPNVLGLCTWSPRLDRHGNSVRGIDFCRELVKTFNFHNYDNLTGLSEKIDPRKDRLSEETDLVFSLTRAASKGDLNAVQRLLSCGANLEEADYDGRTPLHLAASEGHENVVRFCIARGIETSPRDRWGGTPLADAKRGGHDSIARTLEENGAKE